MLGMPSALHVIQLRKNPALLSDGMTPINWINSNKESQRTRKSPARSPLKTSFRVKNLSKKGTVMNLRLETVSIKSSSWKNLPWKSQHHSRRTIKIDVSARANSRSSIKAIKTRFNRWEWEKSANKTSWKHEGYPIQQHRCGLERFTSTLWFIKRNNYNLRP